MPKKKISPLLYGFGVGEQDLIDAQLQRSKVEVITLRKDSQETGLSKSILNVLNSGNEIARLAFEVEPSSINNYGGVYRPKLRGVPDVVLKRIAVQDSLVACIVRARQGMLSAFGRPRQDRHSFGYIIRPETGLINSLDTEGRKALKEQMDRAIKLFNTCGHTEEVAEEHQKTLSEYLALSCRNAIVAGRIATEVIHTTDILSGQKKFGYFAAVDSSTVYPATTDWNGQEQVRDQAYRILSRLAGKDLIPETDECKKYTWVQVVEGTPKQVFTNDELKCYNFYPVPDVEWGGFPVTPIDTAITAITTHINITTHNKMYFQSGRATRGMLVIKSDDVNAQVLSNLKQNFNASINGSNAAFRMPVLGIGTDSEITWQPLDPGGGRDMEFQYLTDMNAREILTAFMMSPDELPGWAYLSKGTASQSLSECIAGSSKIVTNDLGNVSIESFVGESQEKEGIFWSGKEWVKGRAFKSGEKKLIETTLACGVTLKTSPDHRFRTINENGELDWTHQEDLREGTSVLIPKNGIEGDEALVPSFKGKKLTEEIAEILGWITGDGSFFAPKKRSGAQIKLYYHPTIEENLWNSHYKTLCDWGLSTSHYETKISDDEKQRIIEQRGIKSVADRRISNTIYDTDFYRWLVSLGFSPSSRNKIGKTIPSLFYVLPKRYRQAFLKGLFSADGGKVNEKGSVALTIHNDRLRDQIRELLLSLGIRTLPCKGLYTWSSFTKGAKRFSPKLFIKDREKFWNEIGFCQPHKQLSADKFQKRSVDRPSDAIIKKLLVPCQGTEGYKKIKKWERDNICSILSGRMGCSYQYLEKLVLLCGGELPEWFTDYHLEPIRTIVDTGTVVPMYDVEMFDDIHAFIVDGVVTHNSSGEYKMTAARDVGLRPLLASFEDFINAELFPLIDPDLAKKARFVFMGLDAETREQENERLGSEQTLHASYNDILMSVEKPTIPTDMCGNMPLNPVFKQTIDCYMTVGQQMEKFLGIEGAAKEPRFDYLPNQWYFANQNLQLQKDQLKLAQQQPQGPAAPPGGGGGSPGGPPTPSPDRHDEGYIKTGGAMGNQNSKQAAGEQGVSDGVMDQAAPSPTADMEKAALQAYEEFAKSEMALPPAKRKIITQHQKIVNNFITGFQREASEAVDEILKTAKHFNRKS
jgi:intein/homing endonuclease